MLACSIKMTAQHSKPELQFRTWGEQRTGAGRKPSSSRRNVVHRRRPDHRAREPLHVTQRLGRGLPSLREQVLACNVRRAFREAHVRWFRVLQYLLQGNHIHVMAEADDRRALSRGVAVLAMRIARRANRTLQRCGRVFRRSVSRACIENAARGAPLASARSPQCAQARPAARRDPSAEPGAGVRRLVRLCRIAKRSSERPRQVWGSECSKLAHAHRLEKTRTD